MAPSLHNVSYLTSLNRTICQTEQRWRGITAVSQAPKVGCYAIYHDGHLVYVGSSALLRKRVSVYLNGGGRANGGAQAVAGVRVTLKVAGSRRLGDWLMREFRLIHRLRPRDNKVFKDAYFWGLPKKPLPVYRCLGCSDGHNNIPDLKACESSHGCYPVAPFNPNDPFWVSHV
jgi:hypothetical protein